MVDVSYRTATFTRDVENNRLRLGMYVTVVPNDGRPVAGSATPESRFDTLDSIVVAIFIGGHKETKSCEQFIISVFLYLVFLLYLFVLFLVIMLFTYFVTLFF